MIIDTHTHFYDPTRPQGVPWPSADNSLLYRPVLFGQANVLGRPDTGGQVVYILDQVRARKRRPVEALPDVDAVVVWRVVDGQIREAWDIPAVNTVRPHPTST